MSKEKIKKLQVYAEKTKELIKNASSVDKKEFFERDLRKTLSKIEELTK